MAKLLLTGVFGSPIVAAERLPESLLADGRASVLAERYTFRKLSARSEGQAEADAQKKEQFGSVLGLAGAALAFLALFAFVVWDARKGISEREGALVYAAQHLPHAGMDERWIDECALGPHDGEPSFLLLEPSA